jgi:hypothetical protein
MRIVWWWVILNGRLSLNFPLKILVLVPLIAGAVNCGNGVTLVQGISPDAAANDATSLSEGPDGNGGEDVGTGASVDSDQDATEVAAPADASINASSNALSAALLVGCGVAGPASAHGPGSTGNVCFTE